MKPRKALRSADDPDKANQGALNHGTRGDGLAELLADEITSRVLAPGARLDEVTLATRFGLSRTPVRDALRQLEATGLVERRPFRGAVVSAPDAAALATMFMAAGEIEASCARLAALTMSAAERNAMRRNHEKMSDLVRAGKRSDYADANMFFHDRIYAGAHNSILEGFARDLRRRLMPFRRAQFNTIERLGQSFTEHDEIVQAIERGQGDEAAARMRFHMRLVEAAFEGLSAS